MEQVLQRDYCRIKPDRREMRVAALRLLSRILFFLFSYSHHSSAILGAVASVSTRGVHPLDEKYYWESELIDCKDKSNTFTRDRLNDDFCDCIDGSDEPGTSACPRGRFYCRNVGSIPRYLFSSQVNDHICDCCDGSDEYDGSINCPNTCIMGGNLIYKSDTHHYTRSKSLHRASAGVRQIKSSLIPGAVIPKELMLAAMIQWIFLAVLLIVFLSLMCCRCNKPRRRHFH